MKTYLVRSYVAVEINIEAESAYEAVELASAKIHESVCPTFDYDYMEDALVYDEDGEEIDIDAEELEAAE